MGRHAWIGVVLVSSWLLVGCGTQAGTAQGSADADTVHTHWVAAMQHDDRAAALAVNAMDNPPTTVDDDLRMMRTYVPTAAPTGGLTGTPVVQPVTAQGTARIGISRWTFAKTTACFQATLDPTAAGGWQVRQWARVDCH